MAFRERMAVRESRAEYEVFMELSRRHLNRLLFTQLALPFDVEKDGVKGTFIDLGYSAPILYAIFIDGEWAHRAGSKQNSRDDLVTSALLRTGWMIDRFRYKPPLSDRRGTEICDRIEQRLKERGYKYGRS